MIYRNPRLLKLPKLAGKLFNCAQSCIYLNTNSDRLLKLPKVEGKLISTPQFRMFSCSSLLSFPKLGCRLCMAAQFAILRHCRLLSAQIHDGKLVS